MRSFYDNTPQVGSIKKRWFQHYGVADLANFQKIRMQQREVELKFQLMPGCEAILRAGGSFDPMAPQIQQITTYYDTPDRLLFTFGLTLRIRQQSGSFVQTVKSRDNGSGLASSRSEWEWQVANGVPDIGRLAAVPELVVFIDQIVERLQPNVVTNVFRTTQNVKLKDDTKVELSLDIGTVVSGEKSEPICEFELELKRGQIASLYGLASSLVDLAPMWINAESKAARGWSLFTSQNGGAIALRKPKIRKDVTAAETLHRIIGALLSQLAGNIAPTLSDDAEALRQLRRALRHLRAVLRLFGPMLNRDEVSGFITTLRQFAQTLGVARDWDVFCLQTLPEVMADLSEYDWANLSVLAEAKRKAAHTEVRDLVCGPHFTRLLLNLAIWSETCAIKPQDIGTTRLTKRLAEIAPALLDKIAEEARQVGRHPMQQSMIELHDFRKALDRLNAAIRFLGGFFPAQSVSTYRVRTDLVRDIIGAANDADVTKALAKELASDGNAELSAIANILVIWANHQPPHQLIGLKRAARSFRTEPDFWKD